MKRILVTGSGGVGGVNFVRALRLAEEKMYIVGTDYNIYHLQFPDVDARYRTPKHTDPSFIPRINEIIEKESIQFVHPDAEVEAVVISKFRDRVKAKVFLPSYEAMEVCEDKLLTAERLAPRNLAPKTIHVKSVEDVDRAFEELGSPIWLRLKSGAGGVGGLRCDNPEEAKIWMEIWVRKKNRRVDEFIAQEYLPGRDFAWDSFWADGKLLFSYTRERLEYAFKHLTLSGVAGTPSVSRIVHDDRVNEVGYEAVKAIDPKPHGFYSVDLKEDASGGVKVTEVGAKLHTTFSLWSYAFAKVFGKEEYNVPYAYVKLAFGEEPPELTPFNAFPEGYYSLRHIDVGAFLWREDGWKAKIL